MHEQDRVGSPGYVLRMPRVGEPEASFAALCDATPGEFFAYADGSSWLFGLGARAEVIAEGHELRVSGPDEHKRVPLGTTPFRTIGRTLAALQAGEGRAVGYATFECAGLEQRRVRGDQPLAHFVVPDVVVRFTRDDVTVTAQDQSELDRVADLVRGAVAPAPGEPIAFDVRSSGRADYEAQVEEAVAAIRRRDVQKVIMSRRAQIDAGVDIPATFLRGLKGNTPARAFYLRLGDREAAGFSPETVCEVDRDGWVSTQPLAGTRAMGSTPAAEDELRRDLLWNVKEGYEHVISVRLAVEELRSVCAAHTVSVSELMDVKRRGTVQHLASRVRGRLDRGLDAWDALGALFPAVTASGIAKRPALDWIERLEAGPRGLYAGTVCTLDRFGALDAALVLRSIFREQGQTWLQAGAGIVEHSQPEAEWEETCNKMASVAEHLTGTARSVVPLPSLAQLNGARLLREEVTGA